jgi:hypothetical protein
MVGQLDLFKGKRQRGVKPPTALEFATCCLLADTIDRWIMPGWRWTHLPFGEHRDHRLNKKGQRFSPTGNRLKRMGTKKGWPDYIFVGPARAVFWLEMKRARSGRLSDEQIDIRTHLIDCGFAYLSTSSYDEAISALIERGILRKIEVQ